MDHLTESCRQHDTYPMNLVSHDALKDTLKAYHDRLTDNGNRLFDQRKALVEFIDLDRGERGKFIHQRSAYYGLTRPGIASEFRQSCATTLCELKKVVRRATIAGGSDPQRRFMQV